MKPEERQIKYNQVLLEQTNDFEFDFDFESSSIGPGETWALFQWTQWTQWTVASQQRPCCSFARPSCPAPDHVSAWNGFGKAGAGTQNEINQDKLKTNEINENKVQNKFA